MCSSNFYSKLKKLFLQEVIIKGEDVSYIVTLLTVLQFFAAVRATAGATLYSNRTYGVVYKFTVYLHKTRYKRRPLITTVSYKFEIKVAATPPPLPFDNINNYKYTYTALIFCNSGVPGR